MKAPKSSGKNFPITKAGSYLAVCYTIVDLGTHEDTYQGVDKDRRLCLITFEIPGERIEIEKDDGTVEDKPRAISIKDTFSMHEKSNLRKKMESWRGKPFTETQAYDFDFKTLLGVNALIQVAHQESKDGKVYAFIQSVTKPLAEMDKIKSENKHLFFEFGPPYLTAAGFDFPENMPEWVMTKIKESREYQDLSEMGGSESEPDNIQKIKDELDLQPVEETVQKSSLQEDEEEEIPF